MLYLASTSPRRHSLLAAAGISYAAIAPGPEPVGAGAPAERARCRAQAKAGVDLGSIAAGQEPALVLAADTVVELEGRELGKPASRAEAAAMLRALAGREHSVHTALCLRRIPAGAEEAEQGQSEWVDLVSSRVSCMPLSEDQLQAYLDRDDWQGKAGGYGIQGEAAQFMRLRSGELDTVIGLPIASLTALLDAAGHDRSQEGGCEQG